MRSLVLRIRCPACGVVAGIDVASPKQRRCPRCGAPLSPEAIDAGAQALAAFVGGRRANARVLEVLGAIMMIVPLFVGMAAQANARRVAERPDLGLFHVIEVHMAFLAFLMTLVLALPVVLGGAWMIALAPSVRTGRPPSLAARILQWAFTITVVAVVLLVIVAIIEMTGD